MNEKRVASPLIDSHMLSTLELLHYCKRFEQTLFAFVFESADQCAAVLMDLRVLIAAQIRQVIFCGRSDALMKTLDSWNRSGDRFVVLEATLQDLRNEAFVKRVEGELRKGNAPFLALSEQDLAVAQRHDTESSVVECAVTLGAEKIFFAGAHVGLEVDGKFLSYPTHQEVQDIIRRGAHTNISSERLQFLLEQQTRHDVDIVLVEARRGAIYEEVFTHAGSGTLFTREYPNILRPAHESDVRDIMALMQPYIAEGSLKAMREEELLAMIRSFSVYSINGQIVAAAALIDYGDDAELAKLCTLPRFQARGRARALVCSIVERARDAGKRSVFALTVQPYVGEFFERLGFQETQRMELPETWQKGYDFSRPSKAYRIVL